MFEILKKRYEKNFVRKDQLQRYVVLGKITQEEYWAQRRGQKNLDEINKQIIEDGYIPTQTNFQTQKQKIRDAVDELAVVSKSFEDFQSHLFEKYKITVTEKRGRYSYHLPEREKNISERSLGTHYGKEYLSNIYGSRAVVEIPDTRPTKDYDPNYDYHADPIAIIYIRSNLRLVTDLQTCVKAQQSQVYAHKVKLTNLKQMAGALAALLDSYQLNLVRVLTQSVTIPFFQLTPVCIITIQIFELHKTYRCHHRVSMSLITYVFYIITPLIITAVIASSICILVNSKPALFTNNLIIFTMLKANHATVSCRKIFDGLE